VIKLEKTRSFTKGSLPLFARRRVAVTPGRHIFRDGLVAYHDSIPIGRNIGLESLSGEFRVTCG